MHAKARLRGLYKMSGSQFWWFRYTRDGQRYAVSLRTPNEAEAITRAQAILAEGLIAAEAYAPEEPTPRRREIHSLIERYLKEAQSRHKKPLRPNTADVRRYILKKFVADCSIYHVGDITLPKIQQWLNRLKAEGKSADTCWAHAQRVRSFIRYLVPRYLPSMILADFTVPEPAAVGRKNWVRKEEVTRILDATGGDRELKFALLCGFDAGLRREEVSEARVNWFDLGNGTAARFQQWGFCDQGSRQPHHPINQPVRGFSQRLSGWPRQRRVRLRSGENGQRIEPVQVRREQARAPPF